jgi:hypothetical protein
MGKASLEKPIGYETPTYNISYRQKENRSRTEDKVDKVKAQQEKAKSEALCLPRHAIAASKKTSFSCGSGQTRGQLQFGT